MRNFTLIILAALGLSLFSCEKFKEKRFSTTIPLDFVINLEDGESTVVDLSSSITSMVNAELEKVKDNIKRYELVSINYKVFAYWGAPHNTFNGTLGFGNANSTVPGVNYTFNDIDLQAGSESPNRVQLNLNSQDIARIQQYFLDTNGMRLYLSGNTLGVPAHFTLQVTVNIDAIAETKK